MKGFIVFPALEDDHANGVSKTSETALEISTIDSISANRGYGYVTAGPSRTVRVAETDTSRIALAIMRAEDRAGFSNHRGMVRWEDMLESINPVSTDSTERARARLTEVMAYGSHREVVTAVLELLGPWNGSSAYYEAVTQMGIDALWKAFSEVDPAKVAYPWQRGVLSAFIVATSENGLAELRKAGSHVNESDIVQHVIPTGVGSIVHNVLCDVTGLNSKGEVVQKAGVKA